MVPPSTAHASKILITTFFYCLLSSLSGIFPVLAQCMRKGNQISQVFYSIRTECSLPQRKDKFSLIVLASKDKKYRYYAVSCLWVGNSTHRCGCFHVQVQRKSNNKILHTWCYGLSVLASFQYFLLSLIYKKTDVSSEHMHEGLHQHLLGRVILQLSFQSCFLISQSGTNCKHTCAWKLLASGNIKLYQTKEQASSVSCLQLQPMAVTSGGTKKIYFPSMLF